MTDAKGVAKVSFNAVNLTVSGATTLQASAEYTDAKSSSVMASGGPLGISVGSASVTLGDMTVGSPAISAYGSTSVSVPVNVNGSPTTVPISVNFTSGCVSSGKATITSPVATVNGVATTTYTDKTCSSAPSGELITASVAGVSEAKTITVIAQAPLANNVQFVSASPTVIAIHGTGASSLPQSSVVKFKVVDANNSGVAGKVVNLTLTPNPATTGVLLSATSQTSDANGEVSVSVTSGTVPTPVWVVATLASNPAIISQSNALTITTGLPTQDFFSLTVGTPNIEGWDYDGEKTTVNVIASDRLGNPVPNGTTINFISEGGQIQGGTAGRGACITDAGGCVVTMLSANKRPHGEVTTLAPGSMLGAVPALDFDGSPITIDGNQQFVKDGRVTVMAYALGEKSFDDSNGDNVWTPGETYYDLGDPFLDSNENGRWDNKLFQPDIAETFIASPIPGLNKDCLTHRGDGTLAALPDRYADALSKEKTCNGLISGANIQTYVRRSLVVTFSGSFAKAKAARSAYYDSLSMQQQCNRMLGFWLMDENNNPLPAGTKLEIYLNSIDVYASHGDVAPILSTKVDVGFPTATGFDIVPLSNHAGGTFHPVWVQSGNCNLAIQGNPKGTFYVRATTPKSNVSDVSVVVSNGF